jgi:hypothetical protein
VGPFSVKAVVYQSELGVRNSRLVPDSRMDDKYIPSIDIEPSSCGLDNISAQMPIVISDSPRKNLYPDDALIMIPEET